MFAGNGWNANNAQDKRAKPGVTMPLSLSLSFCLQIVVRVANRKRGRLHEFYGIMGRD